jgi:hypothetical protein
VDEAGDSHLNALHPVNEDLFLDNKIKENFPERKNLRHFKLT